MQHSANWGAAMDVGGWLWRLGLEQYEAASRENKIDGTVLPSLTVEDLRDLGVGLVGDRRKQLDAIAALRAEASAPTPLSDASLATDKAAKDTGGDLGNRLFALFPSKHPFHFPRKLAAA
jgi:hypothetical protein